jgi:pimeloyl-ACP methyl ester carboxylesterase
MRSEKLRAAIAGHRLEVERMPARRPGKPPLVFLHEGLGSVAMWRDFPWRVAERTGSEAVVYSRLGYGKSERRTEPYAPDYMHREALETLPALLDALAIDAPVLVGHSDGGSIALIHAGAGIRSVRGVVTMAAHVFVEDVSIASIAAAREAWATTDLKDRLARYHDDAECAFRGWNDAWLKPEFRDWNIEEYLPRLACPVLAIQGEGDEYGTMAQLEAIGRQAKRAEILALPDCRHAPHRDQPEAVLAAIARFVARLERA